jgi:geranylgeranyl pyrophosphate synthase
MILISGALDIHDDIIDQSKTKWSRPTVLGKFGKDVALLVGDALLFKGFTLLYKAIEKGIPADKVATIIDIIKKMFFELGDAEALELRFRGRMDVTPEEYLSVVSKKAADVEAHTRISAILGGGSEEDIDALGKYGRILGMLAILSDDLMDMIDFEEFQHRIKKECLPLPILFTLKNPEIKPKISAILLKETITKEDAETILETVHKTGELKHFKRLMEELCVKACLHIKNFRQNKDYLELLVKATVPPV